MVSAEQQPSVHDGLMPFNVLETLLLATEGINGFLRELVMATTEVIDGAMSCGITTEDQGLPLTVASSDDRAAALDDAQYRLDEGPCLHAMRTAEVVDIVKLQDAARWPVFLEEARRQGLESSLSLPLVVKGRSIGAMNFYSFDAPYDFTTSTRSLAELLAAQAATALFLALRQIRSDETAEQLERALTFRSVIDQAIGIVMGQQRCGPEEAFALLRAHSQNNNKKLRTVAEELVTRTSTRRSSAER